MITMDITGLTCQLLNLPKIKCILIVVRLGHVPSHASIWFCAVAYQASIDSGIYSYISLIYFVCPKPCKQSISKQIIMEITKILILVIFICPLPPPPSLPNWEKIKVAVPLVLSSE